MDQPPTADPIRVVLADDHALVREGTRRILEANNNIVVVAEAADGEEAMEAVNRHEPDVAIIDIAMPKINGIETTRRIKQTHPQVGVLVLTMHDDDQFIFAVIEAGAAGYLLKDVQGNELVRAVQAVHAGESVLHPTITHKVLARLSSVGDAGAEPGTEDQLTDRELEILRLAAGGLANKEIGARVDLSVRTVEAHLSNVFRKLEVGSRTEAILRGLRRGWFSVDELEPPG
ncbi:MAG TPA: response regulator transcription factor [Acidimicrobiia bacterium]|nr:response regulator transcription factor [Acidimicrobiia bacterium]